MQKQNNKAPNKTRNKMNHRKENNEIDRFSWKSHICTVYIDTMTQGSANH